MQRSFYAIFVLSGFIMMNMFSESNDTLQNKEDDAKGAALSMFKPKPKPVVSNPTFVWASNPQQHAQIVATASQIVNSTATTAANSASSQVASSTNKISPEESNISSEDT